MDSLNPKQKKAIKAVKKARVSLVAFFKLVWPIINPGTKLNWNWHLEELCKHLEALTHGSIKTLLANVPPATSKTSLVSIVWPVWVWGRFPEKRFLLCAWASQNLVREQRMRISLLESEVYKDIFPAWRNEVCVPKGYARLVDYTNNRGGCLRIASVGSKGLRGYHCDYAVIDDPNPGDSDGATDQEAVEWWSGTASTRFRTP